MFGPLGVPELLFILVLALLIFGPKRLPEIGRTVGKAMGEFRRASNELRRTLNTEIALEEEESKPAISPMPAIRHPALDSESVPRPLSPTSPTTATDTTATAAVADPPVEPDPEAAAVEAPAAKP